MDIEQDEYVGSLTPQAGLKVLIHDQNTPPLVETFGFAVSPGTSTFAAIRKHKVGRTRLRTNCSE